MMKPPSLPNMFLNPPHWASMVTVSVVGQPRTLLDEQRPACHDVVSGDVAGQAGGDVDEAARPGRGVGADEEALATESGALERLHDAALGLGLQGDPRRHRHHRPGLDPDRLVGGEGETGHSVGRALSRLDLHDVLLGVWLTDRIGPVPVTWSRSWPPPMIGLAAARRAMGTRNGLQLT